MSQPSKMLTDDQTYLEYWIGERGAQDETYTISQWIDSNSNLPYWAWVVRQHEDFHFDPQREQDELSVSPKILLISIIGVLLMCLHTLSTLIN